MDRIKAFLGDDLNQLILTRVVDDFYVEGKLYTFLGNRTLVGKISLAWTSRQLLFSTELRAQSKRCAIRKENLVFSSLSWEAPS